METLKKIRKHQYLNYSIDLPTFSIAQNVARALFSHYKKSSFEHKYEHVYKNNLENR